MSLLVSPHASSGLVVPPPGLIKPSGRVVRLVLPALHEAQRLVVDDQHRVVVAAMGSKWGKTYGMSNWLLREAWNRYQSVNWWCGPTFKQSKIALNLITQLLPPDRFRISKTDLVVELLRGNGQPHSRLEFRSGDRPESLRGEGVHAAVVDEAGYWGYDSYVSVWTTLSRTRGKLRVISTPKGRNFFFDEWMKGQSDDFPEFASYQCPTWDNPFVPTESIDEFRRNLPAQVFQQEIEARFLDESAGVFTNIAKCGTARYLKSPERGHNYAIGIDWAKQSNYTVFVVSDLSTREIVYLERFNSLDWNYQIDRAIRLAKTWNNAQILMDSTGIGDVIFDTVKSVYPASEGYQISNNQAKVPLIQKLQLAFERSEIKIPPTSADPLAKALHHELQMFSYSISTQGKFIYSAPEGYQDDMVMALALCWWKTDATPFIYRFKNLRGV